MFSQFLKDTSAELDEKALLIALFVIIAVIGLSPLGAKVSATFKSITDLI